MIAFPVQAKAEPSRPAQACAMKGSRATDHLHKSETQVHDPLPAISFREKNHGR